MIFRLAILYIVALAFFGWGMATVQFGIFPWSFLGPVLKDMQAFAEGTAEEDTTLVGRIRNDMGLGSGRHGHNVAISLGDLAPVSVEEGIFAGRAAPLFSSRLDDGHYLIQGVFQFDGALHGTIVVDTNGRVVKTFPYIFPDKQRETEIRGNSHGFDIDRNGTLYVNTGEGVRAYDWCGDQLWQARGAHHSITLTDRKTLWHPQGNGMTERKARSGKPVRTFSNIDIIKANPDAIFLTVLSRNNWNHERGNLEIAHFKEDPFHQNDVEALPAALADQYDLFEAGDLVISLRAVNAVFVIDPETLKVKWSLANVTDRQHDPEFIGDNKISIYDNRTHDGTESRIVIADTVTGALETAYQDAEIFTTARGNHTPLADGSMLIVASHRGMMIHVSPDGEVLTRFANVIGPATATKQAARIKLSGDERAFRILRIYNADYITNEQFQDWEKQCA